MLLSCHSSRFPFSRQELGQVKQSPGPQPPPTRPGKSSGGEVSPCSDSAPKRVGSTGSTSYIFSPPKTPTNTRRKSSSWPSRPLETSTRSRSSRISTWKTAASSCGTVQPCWVGLPGSSGSGTIPPMNPNSTTPTSSTFTPLSTGAGSTASPSACVPGTCTRRSIRTPKAGLSPKISPGHVGVRLPALD